MICGADSIDDVDVLRAGGTPRVFDEVYAPSTLGIFLREFTFGTPTSSPRWPASIWRRSRPAPRCCPASSSGRSWTSTRCCARSMAPLAGASFGTPRSPAARCCGWPVSADHHPVDRAGCAGDCRGAAAQRQGWLRAPPPARSSRPSAPPASAGDRNDHAARRLGVRHQNGDDHLR